MAKWKELAILGMKCISRAERAGLAPRSCFRGFVALASRGRRGEADKEPYFMRGHDGLEILPCRMAGKASTDLIERSAFPGAKLTVDEMRFWDIRRRDMGSGCCLKTGPA